MCMYVDRCMHKDREGNEWVVKEEKENYEYQVNVYEKSGGEGREDRQQFMKQNAVIFWKSFIT